MKKQIYLSFLVCGIALMVALMLWKRTSSPKHRIDVSLSEAKDPSVAIKKPLYPVIDTHTHLGPKAYGEAVRLMDALGIRTMVNLSGGEPDDDLELHLAESRKYPGRFVVCTNPDWDLLKAANGPQKLAEMLEKAVKLGARCLKIFKSLGLRVKDANGKLLPVNAPLLAPLWEMAGKLKLPVAIHTGDPKAFFTPLTKQNERYEELSLNPHWSFADQSKYPTWKALYQQFLGLVAQHPKTTFIGVHFGNNPEDVAAVGRSLARYPNLMVDLGARLPEIGRQDTAMVRKMFIRFQDRILFATDLAVRPTRGPASATQPFAYTLGAPMKPPPTPADTLVFFWKHWTFLQSAQRDMKNPTPIQGRWPIHGLKLPPDVLRKIYHTNAAKLFNLPTQ